MGFMAPLKIVFFLFDVILVKDFSKGSFSGNKPSFWKDTVSLKYWANIFLYAGRLLSIVVSKGGVTKFLLIKDGASLLMRSVTIVGVCSVVTVFVSRGSLMVMLDCQR